MNILICDDVPSEIDKLTCLLGKTSYAVNIVSFTKGADALAYIRSGKQVDACFLDIVMPEMNGIDLAKELRKDGFRAELVFLTTANEFAHESYRVDAFDYLLKPPTQESVDEVLAAIESAHKNADTEGIVVKTKGMARTLLFRDISYAEVIKHNVYYRLADGGNVVVPAAFKEIAPQLLRDKRFAKCHNSYIINMNHVVSIIGREITMSCGARIPISKSYPEVKDRLLDMMLENE